MSWWVKQKEEKTGIEILKYWKQLKDKTMHSTGVDEKRQSKQKKERNYKSR